MSNKKTVSDECPICGGGILSFDYYDFSITCLNCGRIWKLDKKVVK